MDREVDSSEGGARVDRPARGGGGRPCLSSPGSPQASWRVLLGLGRAELRAQIFPPTRSCLAYHAGNSCVIARRPGMVVLAAPGSASDQIKLFAAGRDLP